ncbi:MAG TPA: potassium-transporting ATPase subunit C, partial [Solirubrobacteraceae bacterium]|nr:potassium-transporting ATPase subunit C [Solirubrobacteraceae bacterium]
MRRDLLTSVLALVVLTVVLGLGYPLLTTAVSQLAFPDQANGELVKVAGKVVGSKRIGQSFADPVIGKDGKPELDKNGNPVTKPDPRYFQGRPSATTPPANAAASTFSNLGPNNVATKAAIDANIQGYLALERPYVPGLSPATVPVDAANSSASGLDPDISLANADLQAHRVAAVRHLALAAVRRLIAASTDARSLGILGEPGVNVLELNLALD